MTESVETAKGTFVHYVVDPRASRFTVQAFAIGMLAAMGHNPAIGIRSFSGEVDFNSETAEGRGFRLTIQANSLSVLDDVSDKDRREIEQMMNERVLEPSKHPEILFDAPVVSVTRLDRTLFTATLNGSLSFHGVTRSQQITVRIADYGEMLRASGDFTLRQSDYDIKPISVAGGALKVKDELKFSFEMVVRKKD
jgi:polyisoprenoid-binding protein YceI